MSFEVRSHDVERLMTEGAQLTEALPRQQDQDEHIPGASQHLITTPDGRLVGLLSLAQARRSSTR